MPVPFGPGGTGNVGYGAMVGYNDYLEQRAALERQQAEMKHLQLIDELSVRKARREDDIDRIDQEDKQYKRGREKVLQRLEGMQPGEFVSPELDAEMQKYNIPRSARKNVELPEVQQMPVTATETPRVASGTGITAANLPGVKQMPAQATTTPQVAPGAGGSVRAYAGSPTQQVAMSMPQGPMRKALEANAPESVIRIVATEEERRLANQQRIDQFLLAEQGRMERAEMSSADRAASRESTQAWRDAVLELRRAAKDNSAVPSLSQEGKAMAAKLYAKTGQLPPMGMGAAGAKVRTEIIDMAATYDPQKDVFADKKTGLVTPGGPDLAANKAAYDSNKAALTQVTKTISGVESFAGAAKKNGDALKKILDKVPDLNATFLNKPARAAMTALGSTDLTAFNILMRSLNNEYARLVAQPNLAGQLTDTARKEMEAALRPDATVEQIKVALDTLQLETGNRFAGLKDQRDALTSAIKGGDPGGSDISTSPPVTTPKRTRYDMNGNPIKE